SFVGARIGGGQDLALHVAVVEFVTVARDNHAGHQPLTAEIDQHVTKVAVRALLVRGLLHVTTVERVPGSNSDACCDYQGDAPRKAVRAGRPWEGRERRRRAAHVGGIVTSDPTGGAWANGCRWRATCGGRCRRATRRRPMSLSPFLAGRTAS